MPSECGSVVAESCFVGWEDILRGEVFLGSPVEELLDVVVFPDQCAVAYGGIHGRLSVTGELAGHVDRSDGVSEWHAMVCKMRSFTSGFDDARVEGKGESVAKRKTSVKVDEMGP